MSVKQIIAKCLLIGTWNSEPQPIWLCYPTQRDDMDARDVRDDGCGHDTGNRIGYAKSFMDRHFENGRRRIQRAIDRSQPALSQRPPTRYAPSSLSLVDTRVD